MSKFDDFYSKKSVPELLEKLRTAKAAPGTIEKDWYDGLILHLNERQLSDEEKKIKEKILSSDPDALKADTEIKQLLIVEQAKAEVTQSGIGGGAERYSALKSIVGLISMLGYFVIIVGFGLLIFLTSHDQPLMGFVALVVSVVIALPLLAFSNLIHVFIDIEYNTRKIREAK